MSQPGSKFRILSIDGGGIKGVFPAALLAELQKSLSEPISNYFDLIAGTSTGALVAIGLGLGTDVADIVAFYEVCGPRIFHPKHRSRLTQWFRNKFDDRYSSGPLRSALEEAFGERKLGHSRNRLLIPSFDLNSNQIHIYKTAHHPRLETDYKVSAIDIALSTTAAPTYFPVHNSSFGVPFVDGGLWANNPTGLAVVEAITMLSIRPEDICVLSLGCTEEAIECGRSRRGELAWARAALGVAFRGQLFTSMGTSALLLGGHDRIFRCSPIVAANRFELDKVSGINDLKALGYSEARHALPRLKPWFFDSAACPFVPYHKV